MSASGEKRKNAGLKATRDDWETPPELFRLCAQEADASVPGLVCNAGDGFSIDMAASPANRKVRRYVGPDPKDLPCTPPHLGGDAFGYIPNSEAIWLNPPWGRGLSRWMDLISSWPEKRNLTWLLLPSATGPRWFRKLWDIASEIRFLEGRPDFIHSPECECEACLKGEAGSNASDALVAIIRPGRRRATKPEAMLWDWQAELPEIKPRAERAPGEHPPSCQCTWHQVMAQ